MNESDAIAASRAERIVRESYGRLVALLASRSGDIASAEDALSEALTKAMESWPRTGVPDNPEGWLLKAASRKLIDAYRSDQRHARLLEQLHEQSQDRPNGSAMYEAATAMIPDTRFRLMFVCTHPSIDTQVRSALMLQTVLGFSEEKIASAFLVKPATMSARLLRAKLKIRDAAIPFVIADANELPERIDAILEAIYASFTIEIGVDNDGSNRHSVIDSIWLASIVNQLLPEHPEAMALEAMMLFHQARREHPDERGRYVPLTERCTERWDQLTIADAEALLRRASTQQTIGPYQLEAAIQSVHCQRKRTGKTDWEGIRHLYRGLVQVSPTVAATIGFASATCHCGEAREAEEILSGIAETYRNETAAYRSVLAEVFSKLGKQSDAAIAYRRAIGLTESESIRSWLLKKQQ